MIGPEYLGKAVAIRRDAGDVTQLAFAQEIGVNKATMNAYEKGRRPVDEATLEKISQALKCEPIDLLQDAFTLFRYNYLRRHAEKTGVTPEELAARADSSPSLEEIRLAFQSIGTDPWGLIAKILEFLRPDRFYETRSPVPLWGVVVDPPSKGAKAGTTQKSTETPRSNAE